MNLAKCILFDGNSPLEMTPLAYGAQLLAPGAEWSFAELCHEQNVEDAQDISAARDALADPARRPYDHVRRNLGL